MTRAAGVALLALCLVACSKQREAPRVQYGSAMAEVARRFELLGKAANAGRFELAKYELGEIGEEFARTLPDADPPKEGNPAVLLPLESEFVKTNLADLRRALDTRDKAAAASAFERTAKACNGCHQASGHQFIEVPTLPGRSIPSTEPAP